MTCTIVVTGTDVAYITSSLQIMNKCVACLVLHVELHVL